MQVRKLDTSRVRDVRAFVRFPFRLYRDCAQWVPPLLHDMRMVMNRRRYPFYHQSDADFFLVESEGDTLGRIAVIENRPYNEFHGSNAAFFYYWECIQFCIMHFGQRNCDRVIRCNKWWLLKHSINNTNLPYLI